jgi:hypothetical protein
MDVYPAERGLISTWPGREMKPSGPRLRCRSSQAPPASSSSPAFRPWSRLTFLGTPARHQHVTKRTRYLGLCGTRGPRVPRVPRVPPALSLGEPLRESGAYIQRARIAGCPCRTVLPASQGRGRILGAMEPTPALWRSVSHTERRHSVGIWLAASPPGAGKASNQRPVVAIAPQVDRPGPDPRSAALSLKHSTCQPRGGGGSAR